MGPDIAPFVEDDRVHGSLYVDAAVYEAEMDRIFRRGWVFVGHESEIPRPGDWVTRRIGTDPAILARDAAGAVHVLANRCAHRGNTLCWQERGNARLLRCTYHAWSFALDGALVAVPSPGGLDRDKGELGLDRAGAVAVHRGFVFANWSGTAGPLADHLGAGADLIDRLCDLSPTGAIRLDAGWIGHRIESNWKMWPDSDNDGYHFDTVHGSMLRAAPSSYYEQTVVGGETANPSRAVDYGLGHAELDMRPSYAAQVQWLGTTPEKVADYCAAMRARYGARAEELLWQGPPHAIVFPNLFLGEMNVAMIEPAGLGVTVHRHTAVQFDGVDPAFNQRLVRQSEAALGPGSFIVPDDAVTAERMQVALSGVHAGGNGAPGDGGWIDLSRGRAREQREADGARVGHITDETTNRAFWRRYTQAMGAAA